LGKINCFTKNGKTKILWQNDQTKNFLPKTQVRIQKIVKETTFYIVLNHERRPILTEKSKIINYQKTIFYQVKNCK
jgi:hypothetical protein